MEKYKFQAKSEEGLLDKALNELGLKEEDVITKSYEEKGGLFSGKKYKNFNSLYYFKFM